jgi:putative methyltransferase (TIGR04325 family)
LAGCTIGSWRVWATESFSVDVRDNFCRIDRFGREMDRRFFSWSHRPSEELSMALKKSRIRSILKSLSPPLLLRAVHAVRSHAVSWGPPLPTWDAARRGCTGYDADGVVQKVAAASRAVDAGLAVHERDAVLLDEIDYAWPLLASILAVRAKYGYLHLADFGGSLGTTYRQNRRYLAELDGLTWTVVEQEHFVKVGRDEFQTANLRFSPVLEDPPSGSPYNAILFASVLNYLQHPWDVVDRAHELGIPYLIVDRTHVHEGRLDHCRSQQVHEPHYEASYPCRIFSRLDFEERMALRWRLIESWDSELVADPRFGSVGYFFARR